MWVCSVPRPPGGGGGGGGGGRAGGGEGPPENCSNLLFPPPRRRARDCVRSARPSRAADVDPHLDPLPARERDFGSVLLPDRESNFAKVSKRGEDQPVFMRGVETSLKMATVCSEFLNTLLTSCVRCANMCSGRVRPIGRLSRNARIP